LSHKGRLKAFGQRRKRFNDEHKPVPDDDFIKMINPEPGKTPVVAAKSENPQGLEVVSLNSTRKNRRSMV
jgi:hypothetical protein